MENEIIKTQKELLANSIGHAMAYTNAIILGGYASFFAIWNFTKPQLTNEQVLWSALLMCISLMSFVAFEIYGMIFRSRSMLGLAEAVNNPERFEELLLSHNEREHNRVVTYGRLWLVALVISVTTGFSAATVLIWAFINELFKLYW